MDAAVRHAIIDLTTDSEEAIINTLVAHYQTGQIDLHFVSMLIGRLTEVRNLVHSLEAEARQSAAQDYGQSATGTD